MPNVPESMICVAGFLLAPSEESEVRRNRRTSPLASPPILRYFIFKSQLQHDFGHDLMDRFTRRIHTMVCSHVTALACFIQLAKLVLILQSRPNFYPPS